MAQPARMPTDHQQSQADIIRTAGAQHDRMTLVNNRQRQAIDRHVKYLLEKGLMNDFNEWQKTHS